MKDCEALYRWRNHSCWNTLHGIAKNPGKAKVMEERKEKKGDARPGAPEEINDTNTVPNGSPAVQGTGYHVDFRARVAVEFSDPGRLMVMLQTAPGERLCPDDEPENVARHIAWWFIPDSDLVTGAVGIWRLESFEPFVYDRTTHRWVSESEDYGRITVYMVDDLEPLSSVEDYELEEMA